MDRRWKRKISGCKEVKEDSWDYWGNSWEREDSKGLTGLWTFLRLSCPFTHMHFPRTFFVTQPACQKEWCHFPSLGWQFPSFPFLCICCSYLPDPAKDFLIQFAFTVIWAFEHCHLTEEYLWSLAWQVGEEGFKLELSGEANLYPFCSSRFDTSVSDRCPEPGEA